MRVRPRRFLLVALALFLALAGRDARAQDEAAYPHPLFTGPIYTTPTAPYDAEHVRLALRLTDADPVLGDVRYHLRLLRDGTAELPLLARGLTIDSVWVGADSLALAPTRRVGDTLFVALPSTPRDSLAADSLAADSLTVDVPPTDTLAVDSLAAPTPRFGADDVVAVRVAFRTGRPAVAGDATGRWTAPLAQHGAVFPAPLAPDDRMSAELAVTLPTDAALTLPGALVSVDTLGAERTVQTRLDGPVGAADLVFAAGPGAGGPDAAADGPLPALARPDAPAFRGAAPALRYLANLLRTPFPWPAARFAVVPGSAAPPLAVTAGAGAMLVADHAAATTAPDSLLAAALSRAWFGGLVAPADARETWWTDAAAAYLAARYAAEALPEDARADAFAFHLDALADRYRDEAARYRRPLVWDQFTHPAQLRDAHAAAKGAWVLHMLHARVGEEAFRSALRTFLRDGAPAADTPALEAAFADAADADLGAFFDAWVYSAGHPVLEVVPRYDAAEETLTLTVRQVQDGYLVPGAFPLTLDAEVHTLFDEHRFTFDVDEREETFTVELSGAPRFVAVDPGGRLLAEVETVQDVGAWVAQARYATTAVARRRAARALAAFGDEPALLVGVTSALSGEANPAVRAAHVRTLAALPVTPSLERAVLAAADDPDPAVRAAAVEALGRHATDAAAARALDAARGDTDLGVVAAAVRALGRMGAPGAADVVRAALVTNAPRDAVRVAAFDALPGTDLSPADARGLALETLGADASPEANAAALAYLVAHAPDADATLGALRDALDDPRRDVRAAALRSLDRLGTEAARALAERHRQDEPDPLLRTLPQGEF